MNRIVIDITTLIKWNRYPVGIIRTLYEFFDFCYENDLADFVCFSEDKSQLINCNQKEVERVHRKFKSEEWDDFKINLNPSVTSRFKQLIELLKEGNYKHLLRALYSRSPEKIKRIIRKFIIPFVLKRKIIASHVEESIPLNNKISFIEQEISIFTSCPLKENDILVSIGLDWDNSNYKLLHELKGRIGFKIVTCFYDAIPITHSDLVHSDYFGKVFFTHVYNLLSISDKIFCISKFSEKTLKGIINDYYISSQANIKTIYLGSDIIDNKLNTDLDYTFNESYALYVSTIEARKNHILLLNVWEKLIEKYGNDTPKLILVGMHGWGVEEFYSKLKKNKALSCFVTIKDRVSDQELISLYQNSQFCVFPSLVEGWGLGAAEALSYGKVCLISDAESLQEATQYLMPALPNSTDLWVDEISKIIENDNYLNEYENIIEDKFVQRTWDQFSKDFFDFVCEGNQ